MTEASDETSPRLTIDPWGPAPLAPVPLVTRSDFWAAAKQIDGLGGEWTYPVMGQRAMNFHTWMAPPNLYVPVDSFDRLQLEVLARERARQNGLDWASAGSVSTVIRLFPSIFDSKDGLIAMPKASEQSVGLHDVSVFEMHGQDLLAVTHGWSSWARGDNIGFLSREYVEKFAIEMWTSTFSDRGPLRETADAILSGDPDSSALWNLPRGHGSEYDASTGATLKWWRSWTLTWESDAEVLTLEISPPPGAPVRAGVAVIVHDLGSDQSRIIDLFVWPPYRRRGYGRILEEFARRRIQEEGRRKVTALIWEADTVLGDSTPELFAIRQGYSIESDAEGGVSSLARRDV